ncbi:MAG: ATP-grasp domain-containing protein, partial [Candidatus Latescibacterota bacterium]
VRLHEHEAKQLYAGQGIPVPAGGVARHASQARALAADLQRPVVVKAQVLAGGRGKAGGVRLASTPDEAQALAAQILSATVRGLRPEAVLVEEQIEIAQEYYLGITVDGTCGRSAVVVSTRGGVDVEEVARVHPEALVTQHVDPLAGLGPAQAASLVARAGVPEALGAGVARVLEALYAVFAGEEALIAEINPLVVTPEGGLVAVDAVLEVDDAAGFRHPGRDPVSRLTDPRAARARQLGMTFVELGGEVGLICSGAGLGMATVDLLADQAAGGVGRPANFLETGGGITGELMAGAMELVLSQPHVRAVLINVYGGINPIHEGALGIAAALARAPRPVPVVAKALGNRQEETWEILRQAGVEVVTGIETEGAVAAVLRRLRGEAG